MNTYAPSFTNCCAVATPIPLLPPVISSTFPSSLMSASLRLMWIVVIILFGTLDASLYARDTSISGFLLGDSMGHSKAEKAKTHKRIVAIASKRFREEGLAGFGIANRRKEPGLPVRALYNHFNPPD